MLDLDALLRHRAGARLVETREKKQRIETGGPCALRPELAKTALSGNRALRVTVEPELAQVLPDATVKLRVRFRNPTQSPLTMLIDVCHGFGLKDGAPTSRLFETQAYDAMGERADLITGSLGCAADGACMRTAEAFTLEPGGAATATAEFVAEQRELVPPCTERRFRPLPVGTYRLKVRIPLAGPQPTHAETSIEVKR